MNLITSRDNPLVKNVRRLVQDSTGYRKAGQFWLEGDHLCRAALERGVRPLQMVVTESFWTAEGCLLYTSPSPRDAHESRMPSSA